MAILLALLGTILPTFTISDGKVSGWKFVSFAKNKKKKKKKERKMKSKSGGLNSGSGQFEIFEKKSIFFVCLK